VQYFDSFTELRLLGGMLFEPQVLARCDAVETDDFSDLHLIGAFVALRNLQHRGEAVSLLPVLDELERTGYVGIDQMFIASLALEPAYNHEQILVGIDARWLRRLANRRRNA
jgi:hypothetical protein